MTNPRVDIEFRALDEATGKGGAFALKALADQFALWEKIKQCKELEHRTHTGKGYDPVVYVATFLFGFVTGGANMADFERLNEEEGLKKFLGIRRFPDQTTLAQWLRTLDDKALQALHRLNREFLADVLAQVPRERLLHGKDLELFFDDTQLEVTGKCFEEATVNYDGKRTLSWQTLWVGPFLADGDLGKGSRDCSECLPELLKDNSTLWQDFSSYLYADSGSSAGKYLDCIEQSVAHFSVSYNKWTEALERCAAALPESAWSAEQITTWRSGKKHRIQHAWLNYQPQGCERVKSFLVTRHQDAQGEMFWQYSFICCDGARQQKATTAVERHKLKGDRERLFSYVLSDMDLHHPPCQSLAANKAFYALAMLAYNLLQAIKLLHLPDKDQCVRIRTLIHILMLIPVHFKRHARQLKAVCCVASNWLPWWKGFIGQLLQAQQKLRFCSS